MFEQFYYELKVIRVGLFTFEKIKTYQYDAVICTLISYYSSHYTC